MPTHRSEMLNTPIKVLQGINVDSRVSPVLETVSKTVAKYPKIPISAELETAHKDFVDIWLSIRRLTNKAMKQAHFDEFLKVSHKLRQCCDERQLRLVESSPHIVCAGGFSSIGALRLGDCNGQAVEE